MGHGIFIELKPCAHIIDPQDLALDLTNLSKSEMETVKSIVMRGLDVGKDRNIQDSKQAQSNSFMDKPSASAGSSKDPARVQRGLEIPSEPGIQTEKDNHSEKLNSGNCAVTGETKLITEEMADNAGSGNITQVVMDKVPCSPTEMTSVEQVSIETDKSKPDMLSEKD